MRIGFIGAGKMALALARGFAKNMKPIAILASSPPTDEAFLKEFHSHGFDTYHSNEFIARNADIVIFATKPSVFPVILRELHDSFDPSQMLISIAAGIQLQSIEKALKSGDQLKVVRVMPNTPCLVNEGVSVYSHNSHCKHEDLKKLEELFSAVGPVYGVKESDMDAVTGISGSGPGYMYLIIGERDVIYLSAGCNEPITFLEAMADAGVKHGLQRDLAYKLAAQTMVGSGKMVLETGLHPGVLKDSVCSPGGSTIAAISTLESRCLRATMIQAVESAVFRCREIGNK